MGLEGRWWRVRVWRGGGGDVAVRAGRGMRRERRKERGVRVKYMVKGVVVVRGSWWVGRMMVKMVRVLEAGGKV